MKLKKTNYFIVLFLLVISLSGCSINLQENIPTHTTPVKIEIPEGKETKIETTKIIFNTTSIDVSSELKTKDLSIKLETEDVNVILNPDFSYDIATNLIGDALTNISVFVKNNTNKRIRLEDADITHLTLWSEAYTGGLGFTGTFFGVSMDMTPEQLEETLGPCLNILPHQEDEEKTVDYYYWLTNQDNVIYLMIRFYEGKMMTADIYLSDI